MEACHIIPLSNSQSFPRVGLNYSRDRYHERTGLLIYGDIDKKYRHQDIVSISERPPFSVLISIITTVQTFIYNPNDHNFRLQVLYDEILPERVGTLTKSVIGLTPADEPLTYADINGRPLLLPDFTTQPYRRALVFVAQTACNNALKGLRSHNCLLQLNLTEERWEARLASVRNESIGFTGSPFGVLQNLMEDNN